MSLCRLRPILWPLCRATNMSGFLKSSDEFIGHSGSQLKDFRLLSKNSGAVLPEPPSDLDKAEDEQYGQMAMETAGHKDKDERNVIPIDYGYFRNIIAKAVKQNTPKRRQALALNSDTLETHGGELLQEDRHGDVEIQTQSSERLTHIKPSLPIRSGNLATYANESETLTRLIQLGVDLSKVEKNLDAANHLLKANFDEDIKPYLLFLHKVGAPDDELGTVISKNPAIFLENLDDLQVRINYLESKKFTSEAIGRIVTKAPKLLSQTTKQIDAQLGFLQKSFKLTGAEVRLVVTRCPKIGFWNPVHIQESRMTVLEFLGFSEMEVKQILLSVPKIYLMSRRALLTRFDYLHNVMDLNHQRILEWPDVLRTRLHIVKQRNEFLKAIGRDQYDPQKENFVSLKALVSGRDREFCQNVAKTPVQQLNNFLKTL